MKSVICAALTLDGPPRPLKGLVGAARALGAQKISCLLFGPAAAEAARTIKTAGADEVRFCAAPELSSLSNDALALTLAQYIRRESPWAVLFGTTPMDKAWAARTAALLGCGLTADAVRVSAAPEGGILAVKPAYGGKMLAEIASASTPQMLTLRDGSFPAPPPGGEAEVSEFAPDFSGFTPGLAQTSLEPAGKPEGRDITAAAAVIAVGKGVSKENFALVKELAELTGWAIGATRPAVDDGLTGEEVQIGITGKTVSPAFYLGLGVSGKMQHAQGMAGARNIAAVNRDPQAPIRDIADLFVEADLADFLPAFLAEIKKLKGR